MSRVTPAACARVPAGHPRLKSRWLRLREVDIFRNVLATPNPLHPRLQERQLIEQKKSAINSSKPPPSRPHRQRPRTLGPPSKSAMCPQPPLADHGKTRDFSSLFNSAFQFLASRSAMQS
jgi:hypothetical protein